MDVHRRDQSRVVNFDAHDPVTDNETLPLRVDRRCIWKKLKSRLDLFDLGNPTLDWTRMAGAMGVEAARAETLEGLADLLRASNRRSGPFLIELVIP